jgi:hypothetical protein
VNGNCQTCPVESQCAYPYKPTDCCDQRKFRPMKAATTMPNSLDREAFEAWWGEAPTELVPLQKRTPEEALSAWVWLAWQAGAAAERQKKITVPDQMQEWKGMDGAIAFHLIERHANGWDDASKMMHEWLEANRDRSAP